jgi:hypothetical protein
VVIDRSKFPSADQDYTPAQRRLMDARLAESEEDLKQGNTYGPFESAADMIAHRKAAKRKRTPK